MDDELSFDYSNPSIMTFNADAYTSFGMDQQPEDIGEEGRNQ